ncbi:MAG TPA: GtrA family protein [Thermotogota bacterium]|jgi:putative flippase GtrA|nr:GtrA family protein [Thermotogota bacterium]HPM22234.1 GtrA family protein [Thermotogota bacterium]HPX98115.1 GtrA family protein [Thermotogota bacterium]HQN23123.1 GtrA family protein [Thermotogota bacterium]HQQ67040.1 GtrA family protein [Thermotogota bacterium]
MLTIKDVSIKKFLSKDFALFVLCGGVGTLTNVVCSSLFSSLLHPILSYGLGYGVSLAVTYSLNARWIFQQKRTWAGFVKFVVSYLPNFLILLTFVSLFIGFFGWNRYVVYILAGSLGLPLTFILVKVFAFGHHL